MPQCPPELLARRENSKCADCQAPSPDWASVKIGIFICTACAGIHRNLGTHISFVRSAKLDAWKQEQIDVVAAIGNVKANAYYEYNVPSDQRYAGSAGLAGPDRLDNAEAKKLETWIRNKYEHKRFAPPGLDDPYIRVKRGEKIEEPGHQTSGGSAASGGKEHRHHRKPKKVHKEQSFQPSDGFMGAQQQQQMEQPQYTMPPQQHAGRTISATPQLGQMYSDSGFSHTGGAAYSGGLVLNGGTGAMLYNTASQTAGMKTGADAERRAALLSISRLFASPESYGIGGHLLMPHGLNLQAAEFDPLALKRSKSSMESSAPGATRCTGCGSTLSADSNFCRRCGKRCPQVRFTSGHRGIHVTDQIDWFG